MSFIAEFLGVKVSLQRREELPESPFTRLTIRAAMRGFEASKNTFQGIQKWVWTSPRQFNEGSVNVYKGVVQLMNLSPFGVASVVQGLSQATVLPIFSTASGTVQIAQGAFQLCTLPIYIFLPSAAE